MPLEHSIHFLHHLTPDVLKAATYLLKHKSTLKLLTLTERENLKFCKNDSREK
jgi:hypothetical protein